MCVRAWLWLLSFLSISIIVFSGLSHKELETILSFVHLLIMQLCEKLFKIMSYALVNFGDRWHRCYYFLTACLLTKIICKEWVAFLFLLFLSHTFSYLKNQGMELPGVFFVPYSIIHITSLSYSYSYLSSVNIPNLINSLFW